MAAICAGWARSEITPPLGSRLRGYFVERLAEGVHDPLNAKALYLRDGTEELAFVALDLCSLDRRLTARARELAAEQLGLAPERLILHATHTHLGPFAHEHVELLAQRIVLAVAEARRSAAPVSAAAGRGTEESIAFCRRFLMQDGSVRTNPGRRNPEVVRPTAPIDPHCDVLVLVQADGRRLVVVNYALHLDTVGGKVMGADYPYFMEQLVRRVHGPQTDCLFIQGCSGDVNHIDVTRADQPKGFAQAEEIGTVLGAEVLKVIQRAEPVELGPLVYGSRQLRFEVEVPTDEQVTEARRVLAESEPAMRPDRVGAGRIVALAEKGSPLVVEVDAIKLGELALVAAPGELFCAFGLRLKATSSARLTLFAELCHDDMRYIPTADAAQAGGYESWSNILPVGAGDQIVDTALELLG
ncbi:MAG: hypothetical protein HUU35_00100 [Armatimonadetes bacterium]|nr:hypothetical protein [Armatimonadota bacterium]